MRPPCHAVYLVLGAGSGLTVNVRVHAAQEARALDDAHYYATMGVDVRAVMVRTISGRGPDMTVCDSQWDVVR